MPQTETAPKPRAKPQLQIAPVRRVFRYNGMNIPDPNPEGSEEEVRRMLVHTYPSIATAKIDGPDLEDGNEVYTFKTHVGTNG